MPPTALKPMHRKLVQGGGQAMAEVAADDSQDHEQRQEDMGNYAHALEGTTEGQADG